MTHTVSAAAQVRIGWALVAALALVGYFGILIPGEQRLGAIEDRAHDLYRLANRNDVMLTRAAGLVAARERVQREVKKLSGRQDPAATTLALVHLVRNAESRNHVALAGLFPEKPDDPRGAGDLQALTIQLTGPYGNVLRAIADLSKHDPLVDVSDVALTPATDDLGFPDVAATIHVTVYQRIEALIKENESAYAVP